MTVSSLCLIIWLSIQFQFTLYWKILNTWWCSAVYKNLMKVVKCLEEALGGKYVAAGYSMAEYLPQNDLQESVCKSFL